MLQQIRNPSDEREQKRNSSSETLIRIQMRFAAVRFRFAFSKAFHSRVRRHCLKHCIIHLSTPRMVVVAATQIRYPFTEIRNALRNNTVSSSLLAHWPHHVSLGDGIPEVACLAVHLASVTLQANHDAACRHPEHRPHSRRPSDTALGPFLSTPTPGPSAFAVASMHPAATTSANANATGRRLGVVSGTTE
jgi:hypothetical protein